jgi:hypothetical protein
MFLKKSFADMTASMVGSGGPGVKVKCPLRARRGRGWRNGRESRRVTSRKRHSEKGETMTNAQAVGVGVRLFSIWLVVYVIRGGPALWVMNAREGDTSGMAVVLAVMIVMLLIALVLWLLPLTVASRLIPRSALEQGTSLPIEDLQRCGFVLLGLWVLASAIPGFLRYTFIFYLSSRPGATVDLGVNIPAAFAGIVAELLLGFWLLFGAKGLLGLLRWARTAGH